MTQPGQFHMRPRLGLRTWATLIIALIITAAVLVAIAVLALGVLLFLVPALAIGAVLYYLFPSRFRRPRYRGTKDPAVIDGEFRVLDSTEIEQREKGP